MIRAYEPDGSLLYARVSEVGREEGKEKGGGRGGGQEGRSEQEEEEEGRCLLES